MNNKSVAILDIPVARLSMDEVLEWIEKRIEGGIPSHIVTANAEIIYRAYKEPEYADVIKRADLVTADGFGAVWASQKLGSAVPERVTGVDLVNNLFALAEKEGWGIYFLGAKQDVVEKAVLNTLAKHQRLRVTGYKHGYFSQEETGTVVSNITSVKPTILLVALGAPKQEYFIRENLNNLEVPVVIGVGGVFDVLAGNVRRAPYWMQKFGLEWLYRLIKEPRRLGRVMALPKFVLAVMFQKFYSKMHGQNI